MEGLRRAARPPWIHRLPFEIAAVAVEGAEAVEGEPPVGKRSKHASRRGHWGRLGFGLGSAGLKKTWQHRGHNGLWGCSDSSLFTSSTGQPVALATVRAHYNEERRHVPPGSRPRPRVTHRARWNLPLPLPSATLAACVSFLLLSCWRWALLRRMRRSPTSFSSIAMTSAMRTSAPSAPSCIARRTSIAWRGRGGGSRVFILRAAFAARRGHR